MSAEEMDLISITDIFAQAEMNPVSKIPRTKFLLKKDDKKWIRFKGWQYAHMWDPDSNHLCYRIHAFCRLVREETTSARIKTKRKRPGGPKVPANYIVYYRISKKKMIIKLSC